MRSSSRRESASWGGGSSPSMLARLALSKELMISPSRVCAAPNSSTHSTLGICPWAILPTAQSEDDSTAESGMIRPSSSSTRPTQAPLPAGRSACSVSSPEILRSQS